MAVRASLEQAWLLDFDGDIAPDALQRAPLSFHVEVDDLDFEWLSDGSAALNVGLELDLSDASDEIVCSVSGTFRLVYSMQPPTSTDDERMFASTRALADAWPIWRGWLNGMLAAMGLGPPPLPARLPRYLVGDGRDAFDATRQVKAALAADRAAGQT